MVNERKEAFLARFGEVAEELQSRVVVGDPAFGCAVMFVASGIAGAMPPFGAEAERSMLDLVKWIVAGLEQLDFPGTKAEFDARVAVIKQIKEAKS